ncbi:polyprenyl synthetase family protein [bacterium]|nr:polyprenyl synthetase family protein [bacterium]
MDIKEICIPIAADIKHLDEFMSASLVSKVPFVQGVVEYVIQNGGKRLRPILTILSSKVCGARDDSGVRVGAAIEFLHTASLLHDDVIDNAQIRRGKKSANNNWGNQVSVLVGDFFYCRAMDILVNQGSLKVLRVITDAVTTTTEGEIFEITKTNDVELTEADYMKIIDGKTAALIAASCQAGGILGGASEELQLSLYKFGHYVGLAFQLMDDILDYTADEKEFGKVNGGDLKEGKLTLPLIAAMKKSNNEERHFIKNILLSTSMKPEDFSRVLDLIKKYDGIQETIILAKSYVSKAKESLDYLRPSLEKEALINIADYITERRH